MKSSLNPEIWAENTETFNKIGYVSDPGTQKLIAILPLPLIQEEQLSVTGERMWTKYW